MATFDDFRTAQDIEKAIRRIVTDELSRQRPAARYAVVNSIDLADRSIMGTFVGDTEPVRIPFLDVVPANVGQEVRVTGVGSDRTVDGVRGTSDAEARIAAMEAELAARQPSFCSWHRPAHGDLPAGVTKLLWQSQAFEPVNFPPLVGGSTEALIPTDGYYEIRLRVNYNGASDKNFYVQLIPATGAAPYDIMRVGSEITDAGLTDISIEGNRKWYLYANDRLCVNAAGANAFELYGGPNNTIFEIKRLYAGPLIVAPPPP